MIRSDDPDPVRTAAMGSAKPVPSVSETTAGEEAAKGVVGNERLTALAGAALLVLLGVEVATAANVGRLLFVHVIVGTLLAGPLVVKLGSTGYRFLRYYTRSPAYVRRGPPRLLLRILAPLLVATTVVLVGSGIGLMAVGPANTGPFEALHNITFLIWLPLIAVHALAYTWRVPSLIVDDWRNLKEGEAAKAAEATGRNLRYGVNIAALIAGAIAAILLLPSIAPWASPGRLEQTVPAPVIVGLVLTTLALIAVRPLRLR